MKEKSSFQPNSETSGNNSDFYIVSKKKFFILYIGTLGWYEIYWFYKNWKLYKNSSDADIWPLPRAMFYIFFVHSLFRLIKEKIIDNSSSFQWSQGSNATVFVILSIISRVFDRLAMEPIGSSVAICLSLIMLLPMSFSLYQAQAAVNCSCDDIEGSSNNKISRVNYFWLAIGACLWINSIQSILLGLMQLTNSNSLGSF